YTALSGGWLRRHRELTGLLELSTFQQQRSARACAILRRLALVLVFLRFVYHEYSVLPTCMSAHQKRAPDLIMDGYHNKARKVAESIVVHLYAILVFGKVEAGVYGYPLLHTEFKANMGYIERLEVSSLAQTSSAVASSTDGSIHPESVDGIPDPQRTKAAIAHLQQKILKLTEQIKIAQTARDDNVAEYLKLANSADKQQAARIKQVFEKKNQKSAQTILQLQKKLEHYHRKLREVEQNGIPRQPKDVFRDMHQGLKDVGAKVTGFSEGVVDSVKGGFSSFSQATHSAAGAVVSKPREIASLIRNKFGSADNIPNLKDSLEEGQVDDAGKALGVISNFQSSPKYGSEEDCSSATSGSVGANSTTGGIAVGASSSKTNTLDMQSSGFDALLHEIQEIRETQARLEESFETLKEHYQRDYSLIMQTLQEERYRCERLEEQLNDLTELHQNEILNLKQELASMEEKIAYQSYERARDIQEALEACQTRISKMELQQQQQQVVQLEGLENATARNLVGKLINILLAVMAVLLVFVSTVANCVVPLMKTRNRTFSTLFLVAFLAFLWKHWDALFSYVDRLFSTPR
ncbi:hypothetical protein STEG23_028237, partial [Scotinomys teguina]